MRAIARENLAFTRRRARTNGLVRAQTRDRTFADALAA